MSNFPLQVTTGEEGTVTWHPISIYLWPKALLTLPVITCPIAYTLAYNTTSNFTLLDNNTMNLKMYSLRITLMVQVSLLQTPHTRSIIRSGLHPMSSQDGLATSDRMHSLSTWAQTLTTSTCICGRIIGVHLVNPPVYYTLPYIHTLIPHLCGYWHTLLHSWLSPPKKWREAWFKSCPCRCELHSALDRRPHQSSDRHRQAPGIGRIR